MRDKRQFIIRIGRLLCRRLYSDLQSIVGVPLMAVGVDLDTERLAQSLILIKLFHFNFSANDADEIFGIGVFDKSKKIRFVPQSAVD